MTCRQWASDNWDTADFAARPDCAGSANCMPCIRGNEVGTLKLELLIARNLAENRLQSKNEFVLAPPGFAQLKFLILIAHQGGGQTSVD